MPVPGLKNLEAAAIQVTLAGKPLKILVAYLSSSCPIIGTDLSACFGGGLSDLMACDVNAKHVDCNSWVSTKRGNLLGDYADENSCLIFGPDTPITNIYNPSANHDILYIVTSKNLTSAVYMISCSALSSNHFSILIDNTCRSCF